MNVVCGIIIRDFLYVWVMFAKKGKTRFILLILIHVTLAHTHLSNVHLTAQEFRNRPEFYVVIAAVVKTIAIMQAATIKMEAI